MRSRSACLLGNPVVEDSIRRELDREFPPNQFPVDIAVVGGHQNSFATVRVSNFDRGINVSETANPQDFGLDTLAAVVGTAKHVIRELQESGKLRKV